MSITDELREYALGWDEGNRVRRDLTAIADRIDAAHEREVTIARGEAVTELGHKVVSEYVKLPVDADGVPIHVGDVMEWPYGNGEFIVEGIGGNTLFYIDKDSNECEWTAAGDKRHHHEPTVEDVLREFAYGLGVPVADSYVAAAASKLRLAGDAE